VGVPEDIATELREVTTKPIYDSRRRARAALVWYILIIQEENYHPSDLHTSKKCECLLKKFNHLWPVVHAYTVLVKTNDSWPSTRDGQFTASVVQRLIICAMTRVNKHVTQPPRPIAFSQPETAVVIKSKVGSITISFLKDYVFFNFRYKCFYLICLYRDIETFILDSRSLKWFTYNNQL